MGRQAGRNKSYLQYVNDMLCRACCHRGKGIQAVTRDLNKVLAERDAEIAALNHAGIKYLVRIDEQDLEIEMLRARLEVDERHPYDGIYCRDETIRLQDAEIKRLTADNEKLAEVLETAGRLFAASRDALAEVNAENEKLAADLDGYMKAANDYMRENEKLRAALDILQAAMTAKKPIPLAFKKAIIEARAALSGDKHE
jgi:chromosome segregation ATPase